MKQRQRNMLAGMINQLCELIDQDTDIFLERFHGNQLPEKEVLNEINKRQDKIQEDESALLKEIEKRWREDA